MDPDRVVVDEQDKLRPSIDRSHSHRDPFERVPDMQYQDSATLRHTCSKNWLFALGFSWNSLSAR